jgi:hypothetical protein
VKAYDELTGKNAGKITLEQVTADAAKADDGEKKEGKDEPAKTKLVMTVPGVKGGDWVYLFLYTETGRVVGIDWVQVGSDQKVNLTVGKLPDGAHKLALVDAKEPLEVAPEEAPAVDPVTGEVVTAAQAEPEPLAAAAVPIAASDGSLTLAMVGVAVLVLAGSAVAVILIQTPPRPRP